MRLELEGSIVQTRLHFVAFSDAPVNHNFQGATGGPKYVHMEGGGGPRPPPPPRRGGGGGGGVCGCVCVRARVCVCVWVCVVGTVASSGLPRRSKRDPFLPSKSTCGSFVHWRIVAFGMFAARRAAPKASVSTVAPTQFSRSGGALTGDGWGPFMYAVRCVEEWLGRNPEKFVQ